MERKQYNRIKEVLEEKGKDIYWLQAQLKDETVPNVVRWSKNVKQPTIEELFEIAKALDVDVRELLVDSTKQQSHPDEQMSEDYYVKYYGMTKEEYIEKYFNKVNTLTAICRSTSTWAHGEYQELEIGKTYHVSYIGVLRSSSNIMLDDYGDKVYNAGCFDLCENGEPIGRKYTKDPRFLAPYLREMMRADRYPYFEKEIEEIAIPAHLRSIEKEYDVRVLLAVDFGSRAWGVDSKDSDWDIRLVYVHKPEWYQNDGQQDVIEHVYENCIDVLGWDVKKALTLLKHGNLSLLEWLNSPKIYYVDEDFAKRVLLVEKEKFNSANAIRYYSHFYEKNNESILQKDLCETKLFLYILRGILSCKWIEKNNTLPPILLNELIETTVDDVDTKKKLNAIIKKKKEGKDDGLLVLVGFIRQLADKYKVHIEPFQPIDDRSVEALDSLLLDTIQGEQNCDREPFSIQKNNSIEILSYFQGKENVRHIISDNGNVSWLTQERSFADEVYAKGACKLNTLENDTKHVLFLFNQNDEEVGRYYIGKALQGKTPTELIEIKHKLVFFYSWNPESKKWVPCVGLSDKHNSLAKVSTCKEGCGLTTILKDGHYYVVDKDNNFIVPPGKYDYIDGFDKCGLARVKIDGKADISDPEKTTYDRWGLIDTKGNEILPLEYSEIWSFYNKNRETTTVWRGDMVSILEDGVFNDYYQERVYRYDYNLSTRELLLKEDWSEGNYNCLDPDYNWSPSDDYTIWDALETPEAAGNIDYEW